MEEIELFQLENLMHSRTRFVLLDLRGGAREWPTELAAVLASAVRVADAGKYLESVKAEKPAPVVLICEDGRRSRAQGQQLEAAGYTNVYMVTGGLAGLSSSTK